MLWRKIFRRTLTALLIVACVLSAAVVGAAIQIFDGYGECEMGDSAPLPKARDRALERAKLDAQKKAGLYLKTESRSLNSELVYDAISAVTNNIIEISDVQYETITQKITEQTTAVVVVAKLKASIDPNGLYEFIKRDDKEKVTIIQQNDSLQDAIAKNDKEFEDLKEQYKRATTQAEKNRILEQMKPVDRDFLANQKLEEGGKLYYAQNYEGAINLCNEALQIKPNYARAYKNRGLSYSDLGQNERAIQDFNKAIQIDPNYADAYYNRGFAYYDLGQNEQAIQDFNKAIRLNPNDADVYIIRGIAYALTGNFNQGISDATKAIQLNPKNAEAYRLRGLCYEALGENDKAQADLAKAKELGYKG